MLIFLVRCRQEVKGASEKLGLGICINGTLSKRSEQDNKGAVIWI
ncbi:MAG: hypothetical protein H6Q71_2559 [Firmicutes bacterium]|nr:hypothetical protein [Bacillota bacterium]